MNSCGIVGELVNYSRPIFRRFDAARRIDTQKLNAASASEVRELTRKLLAKKRQTRGVAEFWKRWPRPANGVSSRIVLRFSFADDERTARCPFPSSWMVALMKPSVD